MQFLHRHRVQSAMGEYLNCCVSWLPYFRNSNIRFFAHAHGYDVSRLLREPEWIEKYRLLCDADGVITMSRISKKRLVSLGIPSAKIHVIPYGVHIPAELPIRVHSRQVRCIAVGRMVAKKAPHLVIKSFQLASQRDSRLHLDYVGGADWFPAIQMLVDQFELSDRVTLHGVKNHSETLQLIRNADIFIQHSILDPETGDEEGLPVSILEAMAQGLPVVSTRHAGIPEAVVHGETGMLGEEGDATTMANHIVQLANDDNLRHRLGKAGWVRALNNFSIKHESEKLIRTMGL